MHNKLVYGEKGGAGGRLIFIANTLNNTCLYLVCVCVQCTLYNMYNTCVCTLLLYMQAVLNIIIIIICCFTDSTETIKKILLTVDDTTFGECVSHVKQ